MELAVISHAVSWAKLLQITPMLVDMKKIRCLWGNVK